MSIVSDYKAINAKLNGIDRDKEELERIGKILYDIIGLEYYRVWNTSHPLYREMSEKAQIFHKALVKHLIAHGYNP